MRLAITRTDGGVAFMDLVEGADVQAEIAKFQERHGSYVSHREIVKADIPIDRTKRDAIKPDLTVDPAKVKPPEKSAAEKLAELLVEKNVITQEEAGEVKPKKEAKP